MISRIYPKLPKKGVYFIKEALQKEQLIEGPQIEKFEKLFAQYIGVNYGVALGSARVAQYLLLKTLGVKKGDEVIIPAYTCPVVPSIVMALEAVPVFVDVELNTFNIDMNLIETKITEKTKVIIATHIEGYPCAIDGVIKIADKYGIKVIEDCAQAIGAEYKNRKVGSFGVASYFSLASGKQVHSMGGGIVLTNNEEINNALRQQIMQFRFPSKKNILTKIAFAFFVDILLRPKMFLSAIYPVMFLSSFFNVDIITLLFEDKGDVSTIISKFFKRYSNIQAQLAVEHLNLQDEENIKRKQRAELLEQCFSPVVFRRQRANAANPIYHYYSIMMAKRDHFRNRLLRAGYDSQITWNRACSELEMFGNYRSYCPIAMRLAREVLYLPMHDQLQKTSIINLANKINKMHEVNEDV